MNEGAWASQTEKFRCKWTAELLLKRPPDKQWLMNVLGTYSQKFGIQHPIFDKRYVRPKEVLPELDSGLVPNLDAFFDSLPEAKHKKKSTRSALVGDTKH